MVQVNFTSVVKDSTGGINKTNIQLEGSIRDLINTLSSKFGETFSTRILKDGKRRRYINIYVNSVDIRYLDGLSSILVNGDVVDFIPAVSGG